MGQFLRGWEYRLCGATLALAVATSSAVIAHAAPPKAQVGAAAPGARVRVWMIEFRSSSKDSDELAKDFGAGLKAALVRSRAAGQSFDFQTSDQLAEVVKEFRSKGKVVIRDEPVRFIASGETDKWVGTGSISATPAIGADGKMGLSVAARFVRPRRYDMSTETMLPVEGGETRILGAGTILGQKTRLTPITGRAVECQHYLISVAPGSESEAGGDQD